MPWFLLLLAGCCEVAWATALEFSNGFTRLWPSVMTFGLGVISVILLGRATKHIPIGTAYAVWTGIGAVGTATVGIIVFGEARTPLRLGCVILIVAGIAGLRLLAAD
jgi:quaternary ammonium compound-resistance protein SugE